SEGEQYVRAPHPQGGLNLSLSRESNTGTEREVIEKHQQDGENESCRLTALLGRKPERNSHQHEHKARRGQGQTTMKFNQIPARFRGRIGARTAQELAGLEFSRRE